MTFIEELADVILAKSDLRYTAVVLPGRRSGLYLKKALAAKAGKTILLPQIFSIEEYIFQQSGFHKMDETSLLTLLYAVYKDYAGTSAFPLDEFLPTGKTLLSDFNDVDDYLLDAEEVFTYLTRIKEIEGWVPGEAVTPLQTKYMSFYLLLNPMYKMFTEKLNEKGMGYQGYASRKLAARDDVPDGFQHVVFAGLNAVTPSLEAHINKLVLNGKATLLWDTDAMYLDNDQHEAGHFMRMNRAAWPAAFGQAPGYFKNSHKTIDFIGAPLGYSQVQAALKLINTQYSDAFADTVLVLADESLLIPLLSSLPQEWKDRINISGGYPLKSTLVGQLVHSWLELMSETLTASGSQKTYRFDALVGFVANPLLHLIIPDKLSSQFAAVTEEICTGRLRYFHWKAEGDGPRDAQLLKEFESLLPGTLAPCSDWQEALIRLENLTEQLFERCREADLEHEAAWLINSMLKSLRNTLTSYGNAADITFSSAVFFIKRQLQVARIPLKGEPLQGIQILGMLETRSLDFKNVVILGANEGFLPASGHGDSFLPADVRHTLKLPLVYERDSVYAYHFWRLLQRASEITLIYNTESDPVYGKEPSRFLAQIEHELIPAFPQITLNKKILGIGYANTRIQPFAAVNSDAIQDALNHIAEHGLSFTGFFNFVDCPYRFLLANISRIKEFEEIGGDMAANTMGNVFHRTVENVSKPYIGKVLIKSDFDDMATQVDIHLAEALKEYDVTQTGSGYNFLVVDLLRELLVNWLQRMRDTVPADYTIQALEFELTPEIELNDGRKVKLYGKADRVETWNGVTRVMDFKTTHKRTEFSYKKSEEDGLAALFIHKNKNLIQVLYYSWLFALQGKLQSVTGGVYPVLSLTGHLPDLIKDEDKQPMVLHQTNLDEFGAAVRVIIEDIFSPGQTFSPTPSNEVCQYCPYSNVLCFEHVFGSSEDE